MSVLQVAILMLLAVGAKGNFPCAGNEFAGTRAVNSRSQQTIATQEDRRQQAEKILAEANQLQAQGNADSLRKALEKYEQARALLQTLDEILCQRFVEFQTYLRPSVVDELDQAGQPRDRDHLRHSQTESSG